MFNNPILHVILLEYLKFQSHHVMQKLKKTLLEMPQTANKISNL